jgi:hypothetical protein
MFFFRDIAGGRLQRTTQNLHESRFACAIGTDQTIAISLAEFDVYILKKGFGPELHGDIGGNKHGDSDLRIDVEQAVKPGDEFYLFSTP